MNSKTTSSDLSLKERLGNIAMSRWKELTEKQKLLAKKAWGVLTYKWRWQIAMNIPYLIIFGLDHSVPAIHQFDMAVINSVTSRIPMPTFISSFISMN